ncbi:MAG: hypothetical protein HON90_17075 [Halobacteriovoraceae bacterium]|jgi:hypothetical protein|nr:hypothetical protein [Halobacteriovoraceae bacterium]
MTNILISVCILFSFSNAYALEQVLTKITNDENKDVMKIYLVTSEEGEIQSFNLEFSRVRAKGIKVKEKVYPFPFTDIPAVVKGRTVFNLKGIDLDAQTGGELEMTYLNNALRGTHKKFYINLEYVAGKWHLSKDGQLIDGIHLVSYRKRFIGTIGIWGIRVNEHTYSYNEDRLLKRNFKM